MNGLCGRRILVVGINYAPEHTGIAPYTSEACAHLAREGAIVDVLAGVPHYPQWTLAPQYSGRLATRERIADVDVTRLRHYVPRTQSAARRGLYELTFGLHVLSRRVHAPAVVLGVVPSLLGTAAAAHIARRHGARLVVWVQDLMGRASAQSGMAGGDRVAAIAERIETALLSSADRTVVINDVFRDSVVERGVAPETVDVVRNWSHVEAPADDRAETRTRLGWGADETVVLHTGNMGLKQDLTNVVEAARLAHGSGRAVRFVLLGDGSQRSALARASAGCPRVQFLEPVSGPVYPSMLGAADFLLVNERSTAVNMSLPSKLTSYLRAGIAVIAAVPAGGATAQELERSGGGLVVAPGRPDTLLDAVVSLAGEPERSRSLGAAGARYAEEHLSAASSLRAIATSIGAALG